MKKLLCFFLVIIIFPCVVLASSFPDINSEKALVYDLTDNKVLYSMEESEMTSVASLTKIMTSIVAIEKIENLNEYVTITKKMLDTVRWDASTAGLKIGDKVTYEDLLYASLLASGADATNSLAILLSGSIDEFVEEMNDKASSLGMKDTHFVNVTGLDDNEHYSTLNDLLLLTKYALKNSTFKKIFTTNEYELSNGLEVKSTIEYYNKYTQYDVSSILGSKTGFTDDAGLCILTYFKVLDHEIISITLNADRVNNVYYNLVDAVEIIDYIRENYSFNVVIRKDEVLKVIPVMLSNVDSYNVTLKSDVELFIPNDFKKSDITYEYSGLEEISYKNKINDKIGSLKVFYKDELYDEIDILLLNEIKISLFKIMWKFKFYILGIVVLFALFIRVKMKSKRRRRRIKH